MPDANTITSPEPVKLGISACLLGQKVRYDGGHKRDRFLVDILGPYVRWIPVCPEFEAGLGVPRESIRLEDRDGEVRVVGPKSGRDVTAQLQDWAKPRLADLAALGLCGYVLKSKSPSCGLERVKVYPEGGGTPRMDGRGLFAAALAEALPELPLEEEGRLNDARLRESFVTRVFARQRWLALGGKAGLRRADLMAFHQAHKFTLMARNQAGMRRLGRLLAQAPKAQPDAALAAAYGREFFAVLARPPSRRGHTNVLQHLAGFVSERLDSGDRGELSSSIDAYRRDLLPLIVPLTLLRHYARKFAVPYLQGQMYLEPHPHELCLLNRL